MKSKFLLFLAVALAALLTSACQTPVTPNVTVYQTVGIGPTSPASPAASPAPSNCPAIARIGVVATNASGAQVTTARVGEVVRLDATPKDATNAPVPPQCHGPTAVWSVSGPCTLTGNG